MGDKIIDVCSKLDKSWIMGIITILLIIGLVAGFLMGLVPVDVFQGIIMFVLGWFIKNPFEADKQ